MKKFIFCFVAMLMAFVTVNAQDVQSNYAGSSKFTDNWSVTLQGGVLTTFDNFFTGHTATAPVIVVGADKYVTPWLGFGVEGRTLVGTGHGSYNTHTAFDAVNVSGYGKVNLVNLFKFNGTRRMFEPVVYTGLGWGRQTATKHDYMTYRAGAELNFNLGKERAWAVVVNPSVVWGDYPANGALCKSAGNFELTAGVVYHFKNSNGKRSYTKARLYDAAEVAALNARIAELEARKPEVVERVIEKVAPVTNAVATAVQTTFVVPFTFDSAELTDKAKETLNNVTAGSTVVVDAYASVEPKSNVEYNTALTQRRAEAVKTYLEGRGVTVKATTAHGMNDEFGRVAVVEVKD